MTHSHHDITRLRQEYADRDKRIAGMNRYTAFNKTDLFIHQQRERQLLDLLASFHLDTINSANILEVGCGGGRVLLDLLHYGAVPARLFGIDLLHNRLASAHEKIPKVNLASADGQNLPFDAAIFDLVLQFTAFSSVLDQQIKDMMAREMLRVLKPGGAILWYDFWWNPTNPHTAGITPSEIKGLFPGCVFNFRKVTLAPPIARLIVSISWPCALFLEALKLFNSHYLAVIRKRP